MNRNLWVAISIGVLSLAGCSKVKSADAAGNPPAVSAPATAVAPPVEQVWLPAGTRVRVRLNEAIDTRRNRPGDRFTASLDEPLVVGDRVVVPKGTNFYGHVTQSRPSGRFKGRAVLGLKLDSLELDGQTRDVRSATSTRASSGHKKHHWLWIGGGSGGGAAIGAMAAGGTGALIGAGAGAAAGTIGSAITGKRQVSLPAETPVTFTLQDPIDVTETRS